MAKRTRRALMVPVNDPDQIPKFKDETEEVAFWDTHSIGPGMIERGPVADDEMPPVRRATASRIVSARFEADTINRLRDLATQRGMGYQTLMKQFVVERLYEEEKRAGRIGLSGAGRALSEAQETANSTIGRESDKVCEEVVGHASGAAEAMRPAKPRREPR